MTPILQKELRVAVAAVRRASVLAKKAQTKLVSADKVEKKDKSPVTIADYASQAVISSLLLKHFPEDPIVGEEDSSELASQKETFAHVEGLVKEALSETSGDEADLWDSVKSDFDILSILDKGTSAGGASGRFWTIDPIDGTKGFLRGGQYAVCLGLIVNGKPQLGVIGCPNLPVDYTNEASGSGVLFYAVEGAGAFQEAVAGGAPVKITMAEPQSAHPPLSDATLCESVEAGHSDHSTISRISGLLGITRPSVRMDSQAKYCSISRGDGHVYLRLPVSDTYEEKIWDHASGSLLVTEAGGRVTDCTGAPLDFGQGRTLAKNKGIVAAHAAIFDHVLGAVKKVREGE